MDPVAVALRGKKGRHAITLYSSCYMLWMLPLCSVGQPCTYCIWMATLVMCILLASKIPKQLTSSKFKPSRALCFGFGWESRKAFVDYSSSSSKSIQDAYDTL